MMPREGTFQSVERQPPGAAKVGRALAFACLFLLPGLQSGCSTTGEKTEADLVASIIGEGEPFVVTKEFTPFYTLGPQQPGGPDLRLQQDDIVMLIKRGFGYSQVSVDDGRAGYVATADIAPAPPDLVNPALSDFDPIESSAIVSSSRGSRSGGGGAVSSAAIEKYSGELPPEEELPGTSLLERPAFRY